MNAEGLSPLMEASKEGYATIVEPILFHPDVQVNIATWDHGFTALIYACKNNHTTVVKLLLRCPELHSRNHDYEVAHKIAKSNNASELVKAFNNRGYLTSMGHTCCSGHMKKGLQIAARNNDIEKVANFLQCHNLDVNKGYVYGLTPLYIASREGYFEIVQQLLKITEISVNQITYGETALIMAAERGYIDIANLLLDLPAIDTNINKRGSEGSALFFASINGHSTIVKKLLLQPQIEVNEAYGPERQTSLIASSANGFLIVVKLLLRCPKTDITLENLFGDTAFEVSGNDIKEAITKRPELLRGNHSCCLNANEVLLDLAKVGDYKGIRGLAKCPNYTIDINIQDLKGRTGLFLASRKGHINAVNEFLPLQDIDVNKGKTSTGETAYSIASRIGHFDVMKAISQHRNVDVNAGWIHDGWTTIFDMRKEFSSNQMNLENCLRLSTPKVVQKGKMK